VVVCFETFWTAAAAPGLLNDIAWARSTGAASMSNAPTAARPRTLVTFMRILLGVIGYHASTVRPIESDASRQRRSKSWSERREWDVKSCATYMNAHRARRFPPQTTTF
jgi:hypothetical protein